MNIHCCNVAAIQTQGIYKTNKSGQREMIKLSRILKNKPCVWLRLFFFIYSQLRFCLIRIILNDIMQRYQFLKEILVTVITSVRFSFEQKCLRQIKFYFSQNNEELFKYNA